MGTVVGFLELLAVVVEEDSNEEAITAGVKLRGSFMLAVKNEDGGFACGSFNREAGEARLKLRVAVVELLDHRLQVHDGAGIDVVVVVEANERDHADKGLAWMIT